MYLYINLIDVIAHAIYAIEIAKHFCFNRSPCMALINKLFFNSLWDSLHVIVMVPSGSEKSNASGTIPVQFRFLGSSFCGTSGVCFIFNSASTRGLKNCDARLKNCLDLIEFLTNYFV